MMLATKITSQKIDQDHVLGIYSIKILESFVNIVALYIVL